VGLGADWAMSDGNVIGVSFIEMVHTEDIFDLKKAFDVRVSRSFGTVARAASSERSARRAASAAD